MADTEVAYQDIALAGKLVSKMESEKREQIKSTTEEEEEVDFGGDSDSDEGGRNLVPDPPRVTDIAASSDAAPASTRGVRSEDPKTRGDGDGQEHLDTSGFAAEEVYVELKDQSCIRNALEILEDFWGRDVASENGSPRQTYLETALPGGASSPRTARTYRRYIRNWKNELFGKDWAFDVFVAFGDVNKEMVAATVPASSRARRARRKALLSQHRRGRRPSEADGTGEADGCQDSARPRTGAQTDIGIRISVPCEPKKQLRRGK